MNLDDNLIINRITRINNLLKRIRSNNTGTNTGDQDLSALVPNKSMAELQAFAGIVIHNVFVYDPLKFGFFKFDPDDSTSADDGVLIVVTADGKRYKRVCENILPRFFGAHGDGVNDDTTAINEFLTYKERGELCFESKKYLVNGTLLIEDKNVASGNPDYDSPNVSSLVIDGNGARLFTNTGSPPASMMDINRCKRIIINDLQIDGNVSVVGLTESNFSNCFIKILSFGLTNPTFENDGYFDAHYNNTFNTCTIGVVRLYLGFWHSYAEFRRLCEFNQNLFSNCKLAYGMGDDIEIPIQIFGSGNAQSVTFHSCDIYAPVNDCILSVEQNVNDVTLIFTGGTYLDSGIGLPSDLKNVQVFNNGLFTNPSGGAFDYKSLKNASRIPMNLTSHPQHGSNIISNPMNLIINGNIQEDINPAYNFGFTPSYPSGGIHGRYLKLTSASGLKYLDFPAIQIPFTGHHSLSLIGKVNSGNIGTLWSFNRGMAYIFTVTGLTIPPMPGDIYTNNGKIFTVAALSLTKPGTTYQGTIHCVATGTPSASGTLTRSAGTNDATITFSAATRNDWIDVQYGIIRLSSSEISWDACTIYLEAGDLVKLMIFTSSSSFDADIYDVSLSLGAQSQLFAAIMHKSAANILKIGTIEASDDPWSQSHPDGATFVNGELKLFPANYDAGEEQFNRGLIDTGYQEIKGRKPFYDGLLALRRAIYNTSVDIGIEIGLLDGAAVDNAKPFKYRWYVSGNANPGNSIRLQKMKCVYVWDVEQQMDVHDPDSEIWEDTGIEVDTAGNFMIPNAVLPATSFTYYGSPSTDGSWRQGRDGNNFISQRRESGIWVTKQIISA
ncbi:MAG: hypothetical protein ACOYN5_07985 [Bacteroidales bacterium]